MRRLRSRRFAVLVLLPALLAVTGSTRAQPTPLPLDKSQQYRFYFQASPDQMTRLPAGVGLTSAVCLGVARVFTVDARAINVAPISDPTHPEYKFKRIIPIRIKALLLKPGSGSDSDIGTITPEATTSSSGTPPYTASFILHPNKVGKASVTFYAATENKFAGKPVSFEVAIAPVEVVDCCPGGATQGRFVAAADQVCTSNVPITYRWTEEYETSGVSGRHSYSATFFAVLKFKDGYGTDAGSYFRLSGSRKVTKFYEPCAGTAVNEILRGAGPTLGPTSSQFGSPFISLLATGGIARLDATVVGDLSGTYVEGGGCETKEIAAQGVPYTLDCPFHDNSTAGYVEGTSRIVDHHGEKLTIVDLACSDTETFETGDGTGRRFVEVTGHLLAR